jgi:hypothetical protein
MYVMLPFFAIEPTVFLWKVDMLSERPLVPWSARDKNSNWKRTYPYWSRVLEMRWIRILSSWAREMRMREVGSIMSFAR